MPRPRRFEDKEFIGCVVEKSFYLLLKELAFKQGITLSELIRRALEEYVERHFKEKVVRAQQYENLIKAGVIAREAEITLNYTLLKEELKLAERSLQTLRRQRKGTIDFYNALTNFERHFRRAIQLASKLPKVPEKEAKLIINLQNELDKIVGGG